MERCFFGYVFFFNVFFQHHIHKNCFSTYPPICISFILNLIWLNLTSIHIQFKLQIVMLLMIESHIGGFITFYTLHHVILFWLKFIYMKVISMYVMSLGANEIQWTYRITLENNYMSFCPKIFFSYKWIFEQLFLQIVIINAYICPKCMTYFFVYHFWININFWKCVDPL